MPRKKIIKVATAPEKTESVAVVTEKEVPKAELPIESLVEFVAIFTGKSQIQARQVISGVISKDPAKDVIDWLTHVKRIEHEIELINRVTNGQALVTRRDGQWIIFDGSSTQTV